MAASQEPGTQHNVRGAGLSAHRALRGTVLCWPAGSVMLRTVMGIGKDVTGRAVDSGHGGAGWGRGGGRWSAK